VLLKSELAVPQNHLWLLALLFLLKWMFYNPLLLEIYGLAMDSLKLLHTVNNRPTYCIIKNKNNGLENIASLWEEAVYKTFYSSNEALSPSKYLGCQ
jgi:hypothetical protein